MAFKIELENRIKKLEKKKVIFNDPCKPCENPKDCAVCDHYNDSGELK